MMRTMGLIALVLAGGLAEVRAQGCGDTVVTHTGGLPYNPSTLNTAITNCVAASMKVTLQFASDTLALSGAIVANRGANRSFELTTRRSPTSDTMVTLTNSAGNLDPNILTTVANTQATIWNVGFARRVGQGNNPSVLIGGARSVIRDCHFFTADTANSGTDANNMPTLIRVTSDSVLIERNLFRAPVIGPTGSPGRALAIHSNSTSGRLEVRANLFVSTGIFLNKETVRIYANTLVGTRNGHSSLEFGTAVAATGDMRIMNNLFAHKYENRPPIYFANTTIAVDSASNIVRNLYTVVSPKTLVERVGVNVNLTKATGANANTRMPSGFSNYADSVTQKEFPIYQMRIDPTLARGHVDFGRIPGIFNNYPGNTTPISAISATAANSYFSFVTFPFNPLFPAGAVWPPGIKAGAFITLDSRLLPTPLDTLVLQQAADTTKLRLNRLVFDSVYQDTVLAPTRVAFAFANTLAGVASNDTALYTHILFRTYPFATGADSILTVPAALRTGGNLFVKALHFNATGQAYVQGSAPITSVSNLPAYPVNDLTLTVTSTPQDLSDGLLKGTVRMGSETVDSVKILVTLESGTVVDSTTKRFLANNADFSFPLDDLGKQNVRITIQPIGLVGASVRLGPKVLQPGLIAVNSNLNDTVYVASNASCTGATGRASSPYCAFADAIADLNEKNGGTIYIKSTSGVFDTVTLSGNDTGFINIRPEPGPNGVVPANRPIFRGTVTKPALTLGRKNVNISHVVIEMPAGVGTAGLLLQASAGNHRIEGLFFRPSSAATTAASGPALLLQGMTGRADVINNVFWGFGSIATCNNTAASGLRFLNNTVFEDQGKFGTTHTVKGFSTSNSATFTPIIASNFFSGVSQPYDVSMASTGAKLANNVYSGVNPTLQGLSEAGGVLDPVEAISNIDLSGTDFVSKLTGAFRTAKYLSYSSQAPANALLAGSAPLSDTLVSLDFTAATRVGKREVGAFEYEQTNSTLALAYLKIKASPTPDPTQIIVRVSSRNFDATLADSVQVWYSTSAQTATDVKGLKVFALSQLADSGFVDTLTGLEGQALYYLSARVSKQVGTGLVTGFIYKDSLKTGTIRVEGDTIDISTKPGLVFPDPDGVFTATSGPLPGWEGTVVFSDTVRVGSVCAPTLTLSSNAPATGYLPFNGTPIIKACISNPNLETGDSELNWTLRIAKLPPISATINQQHLFAFPEGGGLPRYVTSWSTERVNDESVIIIKGQWSGTYNYMFGSLDVGTPTGTLSPVSTARLDFRNAERTANISVPLTVQGTGFKTSNPLIFAVPMPAGGKPIIDPLNTEYFTKPVAVTKGLSTLGPTLEQERYVDYYRRAASVDSTTVPSTATPFIMRTPSGAAALMNGSKISGTELGIDNTGGLSAAQVTLDFQLSRLQDKTKWGGSPSRSIEVQFLVFDGGRLIRSSAYIATQFNQGTLGNADRYRSQPNSLNGSKWNLLAYPWQENLGDQLHYIMDDTSRWDDKSMLVYRFNGSGNGSNRSAFDVYQGGTAGNFTYDSARALWTAKSSPYYPASRSGQSLDIAPFTLQVLGGRWNFFGLPFNFPMYWGDIARASNLTTANVHQFNLANNTWEPVRDSTVVYPWAGIGIQVPTSTVLTFPLIDSARSTLVALPKRTAKSVEGWTSRLRISNSTAEMHLRFGKAEKPEGFGVAPSVPGQNFRAELAGPTGRASELITSIQEGKEGIWPLHLTRLAATSEPVKLQWMQEVENPLPHFLVETTTQKVIPLSHGQEIPIDLADSEAKTYSLVVGESLIPQALSQGMSPHLLKLGNFPNPFGAATRIRYAVPVQHIDVSYTLRISDLRGRQVYSRVIKAGAHLDFTWDGKGLRNEVLPAGHYKLNLEARTATGAIFKAKRDLLKL